MDYHEAKYRTLWKLAFAHKEYTGFMLIECHFCPLNHCHYCPVRKLCEEYMEMRQTNKSLEDVKPFYWQYLFNQLLALEMPDV